MIHYISDMNNLFTNYNHQIKYLKKIAMLCGQLAYPL